MNIPINQNTPYGVGVLWFMGEMRSPPFAGNTFSKPLERQSRGAINKGRTKVSPIAMGSPYCPLELGCTYQFATSWASASAGASTR